jgi:CBS domain-containing protein
MTAQQIMTTNPACCTPDTTLNQVARMMVEHDCGEIPVTDSQGYIQGVITDRDIACRAVAHDCNPCQMTAGEVMSKPAVTANTLMSSDEVCQLMEQNMIRRIPVVDESGCCCGIISQADLARKSDGQLEEVVKCVSQPTHHASNVATG